MVEGEDWGSIAQSNTCEQGGTLFTPCDADGTPRTVLWSDTAPAQGCWVDTGEPAPTLRSWSQSQGLWVELTPYVKCQIPGIAKVNNRLELATTIENFKHGVMLVFMWFLAILGVVSIFIIINTIKLSVFSRRNEISIMQYVGATGWFISLPYIIEGAIIGIVSSVAAYFIEWYIYSYIERMVVNDLQMISFLPFSDIRGFVLWGFIGLGIVLGVVGSVISLGRYLKQ
jgi:cell division protein FtsX